jgi:branched-chain amino acid aminotransferase
MKDLQIQLVSTSRTKPADDKLGFGSIFTDHMFVMEYTEGTGWHSPKIMPYQEFSISPAALVFHYAQAIFEGAKAYSTADDKILLFRIRDNFSRMNRSAKMVCIPEFDVDEVVGYLKKLLVVDKKWAPKSIGTSIYIRPFIIATEPVVGVKASATYKFFIILSPVGPYYPKGFNPTSIKVEDKYVRAVKGGLGEAKTSGNYAASLRSGKEAKAAGYDQVLWLDGIERKYVEEVGTSNIFFKINGEIITPPLEGTILPGITRDSVIKVSREMGLKVTERRIAIDEVFEAHEKGQLEEVFGSGTAAVISPVGRLLWKDKEIVINENKTGEFTQKLFETITGIQYGKLEDKFGWIEIAVE